MKKQVSVANLSEGPVWHPTLPGTFIMRVEAFKAKLSGVDPASLDRTIDDFRRDVHPDADLAIWERIASTFQTYLLHNPTADPAIRKDIFAVLVGASMGTQRFEHVTHLNDQQIQHLALNFRGL